MRSELTRRGALGIGVAALPLAGATEAKSTRKLPIGIATMQFREYTNARLAKELSEQGFRIVQLFFTQTDSDYWKYGGRSDLPGMTPERAREIAATYRSAGLSIHSMGVYTTLIHADAAERKANLAYFENMMKIGGQMGVRTFVSEAGHYQPPGPAPAIPYDYQDDVWKMAVETVKDLARMAEAQGATVLLEPIYRSIFATAKRTRVFLEEVGSPRVRALLDPANLLEANDLEEMFEQLHPWISCIHAKDRKLHVTTGVAAGQGDLDYRKLVTLAAKRTPGVPVILEYVGSSNYKEALEHLRNAIRLAGLRQA
ncbi:MAG: sugar phosphate isomerase/epimerase family protein [Bryobacteraceae bacterium]